MSDELPPTPGDKQRILLVDSSKFRPRAFMQVGRLQDVNGLITDRNLPVAEQEFLRTLPLKLTLVAP